MHSVIISNGGQVTEKLVRECLAEAQECICADGAANQLHQWGIIPTALVGDMDSISAEVLDSYRGRTTVMVLSDQYATDLEKSLKVAIARGATQITVLGSVGGRIDHTLTNLAVLHKFSRRVQLHVADSQGRGSIWVTVKQPRIVVLENVKGKTISLVPFGVVRGVTTLGLQYPLAQEALAWGVREGQSNLALEDTVSVTFTDGALFVYTLGSHDSEGIHSF